MQHAQTPFEHLPHLLFAFVPLGDRTEDRRIISVGLALTDEEIDLLHRGLLHGFDNADDRLDRLNGATDELSDVVRTSSASWPRITLGISVKPRVFEWLVRQQVLTASEAIPVTCVEAGYDWLLLNPIARWPQYHIRGCVPDSVINEPVMAFRIVEEKYASTVVFRRKACEAMYRDGFTCIDYKEVPHAGLFRGRSGKRGVKAEWLLGESDREG